MRFPPACPLVRRGVQALEPRPSQWAHSTRQLSRRYQMRTSNLSKSPGRHSIIGRRLAMTILVVVALVAGYGTLGMQGPTVSAQKAAALQGMGTVSGTVTAAK